MGLASLTKDARLLRGIQTRIASVFAYVGETDKALAALGPDRTPADMLPVLLHVVEGRLKAGDRRAAAQAAERAFATAMRIPNIGVIDNAAYLHMAAMAYALVGDKEGVCSGPADCPAHVFGV